MKKRLTIIEKSIIFKALEEVQSLEDINAVKLKVEKTEVGRNENAMEVFIRLLEFKRKILKSKN